MFVLRAHVRRCFKVLELRAYGFSIKAVHNHAWALGCKPLPQDPALDDGLSGLPWLVVIQGP